MYWPPEIIFLFMFVEEYYSNAKILEIYLIYQVNSSLYEVILGDKLNEYFI